MKKNKSYGMSGKPYDSTQTLIRPCGSDVFPMGEAKQTTNDYEARMQKALVKESGKLRGELYQGRY